MEYLNIDGIVVEVEFKRIKNIYLRVYPPDARVHISAPKGMPIERVRLFALDKMDWIHKRSKVVLDRENKSFREYVSGEFHYFKGERYSLNVIYSNHKPKVEVLGDGFINLYVKDNATAKKREEVMREWYRNELKIILPPLIDKWETSLGVKIDCFDIRLMKSIWGSCNIRKKKIMFNLELMKKSNDCIEYIVLHELSHLLERSHNARFKSILDIHMPSWRKIKDELNTFVG
ncbi:MAG: SprT family zinc-dependent metalloprotease [Bacteroidales bacterium]|nr:SprT family zinc-dependent metalloprotease [Bacteroidales bacterium]MDD4684424.1 SprT family zinc-dependent metalloprotease [Bacteroidales bacterium]